MRHEQTDAEAAMWRILRSRRFAGFKFRRQAPCGNCILDFVCYERRLVIEIDGSQHAESDRDAARDLYLASQGFRVVRYWNNEVLRNPAGVAEHLLRLLQGEPDPSPGATLRAAPPSPARGEG
jgi:very-short-patch-repair endonuclease